MQSRTDSTSQVKKYLAGKFLDEYQLMCLICDPYYCCWRSTFKLERSVKVIAQKMVEHFVPRLEERSMLKRKNLLQEFTVSS